MTDISLLTLLLIYHWLGDFVLQTHYMATNKSSSNRVLASHVLTYSSVIGLGTAVVLILLRMFSVEALLIFTVLNGILHFITDYVTSRITKYLWASNRTHDFFVVIGLDQLIHGITLLWSFYFLILRYTHG